MTKKQKQLAIYAGVVAFVLFVVIGGYFAIQKRRSFGQSFNDCNLPIPGQIGIVMAENAKQADAEPLAKAVHGHLAGQAVGAFVIVVPAGTEDAAVKYLAAQPGVEAASQDYSPCLN